MGHVRAAIRSAFRRHEPPGAATGGVASAAPHPVPDPGARPAPLPAPAPDRSVKPAPHPVPDPDATPAPQPPGARFPLLHLPGEIRELVYAEHFLSTRLAFDAHPAPKGLALLRTCRQVHREIGQTWLGQVEFFFRTPRCMLRGFRAFPPALLPMVRRARVVEDSLGRILELTLCDTLKSFPALALDRLTVLSLRPRDNHDSVLHDLVNDSEGWKELCYIYDMVEPSARPLDGIFSQQLPEPATWQSRLEKRDGCGLGAYFGVYRGTKIGWRQVPIAWAKDGSGPHRAPMENGDVASPAKTALVVARRGERCREGHACRCRDEHASRCREEHFDVSREFPWCSWEKYEGEAGPDPADG